MKRTHVYVLLTDTGTLFTQAIKQYTKAPYNHSSLSFDLSLTEMYSFGRKHPRNPVYGGFIQEEVHQGVYRLFPETRCALYQIEVTEREIAKMKRIIRLFRKKRKLLTYNLFGLFGVALNEGFELSGSYFCSQFVSEVLMRSGIRLWNKPPSLMTPEDFRSSSRFILLYEGKLKDYVPPQALPNETSS